MIGRIATITELVSAVGRLSCLKVCKDQGKTVGGFGVARARDPRWRPLACLLARWDLSGVAPLATN